MNYGKIIYDILSNDSDVTNKVGSRIYPDRASQGASYPYIVYSDVANPATNVKEGKAPVDQPTFQVSVFAKNKNEAADTSEKVRSALERTSGDYQGYTVADIAYDDYQSLYDEDQNVHHIASDFELFIQRT